MKNLKNTLQNAFHDAQIVASKAAGYAGMAIGILAGDVPSAVFAAQVGNLSADKARLKKQIAQGC